MTQKISLVFYKNLIVSDFLILRKKYKGSKLFFNSFLQITVSRYVTCLNFLEILKNLKQFISLLLFLKSYNYLFLFYSTNKQHRILLKGHINKIMSVPDMICLQNLKFCLPSKYSLKIQETEEEGEDFLYLKFFNSLGFIPGRNFFQALQKQILFFFAVNIKSRQNSRIGEYILFNDVLELQKLFFLLLIVKSVLQNK